MRVQVEGKIIMSRENNINKMSKSTLGGRMESSRKGKRKPMQMKKRAKREAE